MIHVSASTPCPHPIQRATNARRAAPARGAQPPRGPITMRGSCRQIFSNASPGQQSEHCEGTESSCGEQEQPERMVMPDSFWRGRWELSSETDKPNSPPSNTTSAAASGNWTPSWSFTASEGECQRHGKYHG